MQKVIILFFIFTLSCCTSNTSDKQNKFIKLIKNYTLAGSDYEVIVEKFDSTVTHENRYNDNNTVYKPDKVFRFKFQHISKDKEVKFFKKDTDRKAWEFVNADQFAPNIINTVELSVANGNPIAKYIPDYNQTVIHYKLGKEDSFSSTGAIENEANVWIHPPRKSYFKILQLNPFPYIKAPYKIGTKWNWRLKIGDSWSDKRWKEWTGEIKNLYKYEITNQLNLDTHLGVLNCFEITSTANSRLGETKLLAYFNSIYGFVKLDYTNIDGSKTILELTETYESLASW